MSRMESTSKKEVIGLGNMYRVEVNTCAVSPEALSVLEQAGLGRVLKTLDEVQGLMTACLAQHVPFRLETK